MLPLLGAAALVLVAGASWGSPYPAGREALKSPQNVNVSIIDDNITLRWERSPENGRNVTFSTYYQIPFETDWTELPTCQHVTASECTFSSDALNDVYEEVQLRVRAVRGNDASAWCEVDSFVPFSKAQIGPPELHLEAEDKAIKINLSPPGTENSTMWATELLAFRYNIVFWDNSSMEVNIIFYFCFSALRTLSKSEVSWIKTDVSGCPPSDHPGRRPGRKRGRPGTPGVPPWSGESRGE
ncbi:interferon alpha/beta receptor 1-like [Suncus etruscus]|uniref:interferon alpha/beta receptor 1-like n=1 Tax=Suncus etruscus TaxID=109475 RepID=UPI0021106F8F|nr:interferon alpha/beta receptor 1-like [Suncus etruscus]